MNAVEITEIDNAIIIDDSKSPVTFSLELNCQDAIEASSQRTKISQALETTKKLEKQNWKIS